MNKEINLSRASKLVNVLYNVVTKKQSGSAQLLAGNRVNNRVAFRYTKIKGGFKIEADYYDRKSFLPIYEETKIKGEKKQIIYDYRDEKTSNSHSTNSKIFHALSILFDGDEVSVINVEAADFDKYHNACKTMKKRVVKHRSNDKTDKAQYITDLKKEKIVSPISGKTITKLEFIMEIYNEVYTKGNKKDIVKYLAMVDQEYVVRQIAQQCILKSWAA